MESAGRGRRPRERAPRAARAADPPSRRRASRADLPGSCLRRRARRSRRRTRSTPRRDRAGRAPGAVGARRRSAGPIRASSARSAACAGIRTASVVAPRDAAIGARERQHDGQRRGPERAKYGRASPAAPSTPSACELLARRRTRTSSGLGRVASLEREDPRDARFAPRIRRQTVERLRRNRDDAAAAQERRASSRSSASDAEEVARSAIRRTLSLPT